MGHVSIEGLGERAVVEGCAFELAVRDSGEMVLVFERAGDGAARMHLDRVPARAAIELTGIWFDRRGLAFPTTVELEGAEVIGINGLRMGASDRLPGRIRERATVLAVAERSGALLVRPTDDRLPDLRVRVDSNAEVVTTAGRPSSLSRLAFGDSVEIAGRAEDGMVLASRVQVPAAAEERSPSLIEVLRGTGLLQEIERVLGGGTKPAPPERDGEREEGSAEKRRGRPERHDR